MYYLCTGAFERINRLKRHYLTCILRISYVCIKLKTIMNYALLLLKVSSILGAEKIKSNIDKYTREEHPTSSINKKRHATSILYRTDVKLEFAGRLCATNVGHCKPCQRELYREWAFRFGYVRYFLYICRLNEIP